MKIRKYIKNKKVLATILAVMIGFSSVIATQTKTMEIKNEQTRIEYKIENKVIGIKNKGEMSMRNMTTVIINGKEYTGKKMMVKASAYSTAKDEGGAWAYNGERLKVGEHIAVDFKVIPMNSLVYIPQLGKIYKAVDTGSAIRGAKIDILMATKQQCKNWGVKELEIIILN